MILVLISRHDMDPLKPETYYYPSGTKCMIMRKSSYTEYIDYHAKIGVIPYIPYTFDIEDVNFFEISMD